MSCILLTGSEGLIGSSLVKRLLQQDLRLKLFDLRLGSTASEKSDILNKVAVQKALDGCIGVVHLAGMSRVISAQKSPQLCLAYNVEGTMNVIQAILESPYKPWLIYASSREVYGQQDFLPVKEDAPLKPLNVYAHSKVRAEKKVLDARQEGISTAILRFSNVFGSPLDHRDRVIPAFCRAALMGGSLKVEGSHNIFDFTFVEDVVRGINQVINIFLEKPQNLPPIHFTTGRGISLGQAAKTIVKLANSFSEIKEAPSRSFDVSRFYGDSFRAKSLLGWTPSFSFEEAIEKFLPNLKRHLQEEVLTLKKVAS